MSNEIAYTVSAKAQLGVLVANGHKDTKAESTGEKFFAPISHSPIPDLHFSLFTSHFS
jgi:hypothetical protein